MLTFDSTNKKHTKPQFVTGIRIQGPPTPPHPYTPVSTLSRQRPYLNPAPTPTVCLIVFVHGQTLDPSLPAWFRPPPPFVCVLVSLTAFCSWLWGSICFWSTWLFLTLTSPWCSGGFPTTSGIQPPPMFSEFGPWSVLLWGPCLSPDTVGLFHGKCCHFGPCCWK